MEVIIIRDKIYEIRGQRVMLEAVKMSIEVVRAFIALKQFALRQNSIDAKLQQIEDRLGEHDVQLNAIGLRRRA